MMLVLTFAGWMQCRLPTDPDPFDEPRGVTGYTFALPGEPDLDRVIRFQPQGTVARSFGPTVGVGVTGVRIAGRRVARHPLLGAAVELLGDPVYEGRNGLAALERGEPMVPFHLRIAGGGVELRHAHNPSGMAAGLPATGMLMKPPGLAREAGLPPARTHLAERRLNLEGALRQTVDAEVRAGLSVRLQRVVGQLDAPEAVEQLQNMVMTHGGVLQGNDWEVSDPEGRLNFTPLGGWEVEIRTGAFDLDTLCGWASGQVAIPLDAADDLSARLRRF